jgi:beta-phosphoglucomutase-like phosphatase (HAD superfamily)
LTRPPAAILDVDGTLVDTNYHHAVAWFGSFGRLDVTLPLYRIHRHIWMGAGAACVFERLEDLIASLSETPLSPV